MKLKVCIFLCFTVLQIKFECHLFPSIFLGVKPLLELKILEIHSFPHVSSHMLLHNLLSWNFCIWLCFTVLQIKSECHQHVSIFVGVMPLLELRILEIHSFPLFSLTCFGILSWYFAYDLFTVLQITFECHQFASIFVGVMSRLELRILEIHSCLHSSLTCFDILSWNCRFEFVWVGGGPVLL